MPRLENRVAVVTGFNSGIGQAVVEEFAQAGADVGVTWHTDQAGAEEAAARVEAAGRRAVLRRLDVGEETSVAALFEAVAAQLGASDILVNNAGTGGDAQVADVDAAKGGLPTFTRSPSPGVAALWVNAEAPGLIHTPMTAERTEDPEAMVEELPRIPRRRPGEPWEVARLVLCLASDGAAYVTGGSFTIDGGLEMNRGQGA